MFSRIIRLAALLVLLALLAACGNESSWRTQELSPIQALVLKYPGLDLQIGIKDEHGGKITGEVLRISAETGPEQIKNLGNFELKKGEEVKFESMNVVIRHGDSGLAIEYDTKSWPDYALIPAWRSGIPSQKGLEWGVTCPNGRTHTFFGENIADKAFAPNLLTQCEETGTIVFFASVYIPGKYGDIEKWNVHIEHSGPIELFVSGQLWHQQGSAGGHDEARPLAEGWHSFQGRFEKKDNLDSNLQIWWERAK